MRIAYNITGADQHAKTITVEYFLIGTSANPVQRMIPLPMAGNAPLQGQALVRAILEAAPNEYFRVVQERSSISVDMAQYVGQRGDSATLPVEEPTAEEMSARFSASITARLNAFAQERRYDSMLALCTYATSKNPTSAAEGQRGVYLRDLTWDKAREIEAAVLAGTRPMPEDFASIAGEFPALTWS